MERRRILLGAGPLLAVTSFFLLPSDMPGAARWTAGVALWMALWWVGEVVPLAATALLPVILFPLLRIASIKQATAPFANPNVFLFMGGFFFAKAFERHNLHKRIALWITLKSPSQERGLLLGIMGATFLLSMWMSNTATAILMIGIALSLLTLDLHIGTEKALFIGIAYAASIGGIATLIGTPPNLILAGVFQEMFHQDLAFWSFTRWGFPLALVLFAAAYGLLVVLFRVPSKKVSHDQLRRELESLGTMSPQEIRVATVFGLVVLGWVSRPLLNTIGLEIHDATLAIAGSLVLFILTYDGKPLLFWEDAGAIPWGVILLFGGGFSLAHAFGTSGLASYLAHKMEVIQQFPLWVIRLSIITFLVMLTEFTSNTATASLFLPLFASLSQALHINPLSLMLPATFAVSLAFMFPVATPPNALVFTSGRIRVKDLVRAGLWLNMIGILLIFWLT